MKPFYPFFLLSVFLVLAGCEKNDDAPPPNPVDLLPPATQTGENTFGCLLDGETFLPGGGINPLDCVYQFVDGGYYFTLQGNRRINGGDYQRIALITKQLQIEENKTYILSENTSGNFIGSYRYNFDSYYTTKLYSGEVTITKLDFENNIVSGTFWFDIKNKNGIVHEIRKGRFDMHFTQ